MRGSGYAALEDDLTNVVKALDMFVGGPWIGRDRADTVVGLAYDIEGQRPVPTEAKTFSRRVCQFT